MVVETSVVVPAFNEAERLGLTLERVTEYLTRRQLDYEIIVVDDGSEDATAELADSFSDNGVRTLRLGRNRGKGFALKQGVLESVGRRVLVTDADLSTPIEDMEALEARMDSEKADLVLGSRALSSSKVTVHQPFYRELMGKVFNVLIRLLGLTRFRDTQCGFKLMDGEIGRHLFAQITVERFAYDVELVWLAETSGYRVVDVGVRWANSDSTRVSAVVDSVRMLWDVVRLRWAHRRRVFRPPGTRG